MTKVRKLYSPANLLHCRDGDDADFSEDTADEKHASVGVKGNEPEAGFPYQRRDGEDD